MGFFRNPEIRRAALLLSLLTAALAGTGAWLFGGRGAAAMGGACLLLCGVFFLFTYRRYRRLREISRRIDGLLHGREAVDFHEFAEGELSVLQDEVSKLTVRLREQADTLLRDKRYLSDALADISHQLRTPLTSMNLIVTLLRSPDTSEERRRELLQELTRSLSRVDWLIDALLKMSKIDAGTAGFQRVSVAVEPLLRQAADPLVIPMELRGQQLRLRVEGEPRFLGDPLWSVEAVGNVLKNCMEHTPNGGQIEVTAAENALYTEIAVRDTGEGIDPQDLPHLFERFYRGKNAGEQSVGIGLALARLIVCEQNGTIKAQNRPEGGAQFTIRFYKSAV